MRFIKLTYHIITTLFILATIYFGLNIDQMVRKHGFFTFLNFMREWLTYGIVLFAVVYAASSLRIYYLERKLKKLKEENDEVKNQKDL